MGFFDSLVGRDTSRNKALALYKRGMEKAKKQNHQGAIDDYSAAIDLSEGPGDVRAMALSDRAGVCRRQRQFEGGGRSEKVAGTAGNPSQCQGGGRRKTQTAQPPN